MAEVKIRELPPFFARQKVAEFFPGVVSPKTLANLASRGEGPPFIKTGRKIIYETQAFIAWLKKRGVEVKTMD